MLVHVSASLAASPIAGTASFLAWLVPVHCESTEPHRNRACAQDMASCSKQGHTEGSLGHLKSTPDLPAWIEILRSGSGSALTSCKPFMAWARSEFTRSSSSLILLVACCDLASLVTTTMLFSLPLDLQTRHPHHNCTWHATLSKVARSWQGRIIPILRLSMTCQISIFLVCTAIYCLLLLNPQALDTLALTPVTPALSHAMKMQTTC